MAIDSHVHELYCQLGQDWGHADLTERTGTPNIGGACGWYWGYEWNAGKTKQIVFNAGDDVHELYCQLGHDWEHADLTQRTGAPAVSGISGYEWEAGQSKQVVYPGYYHHIHELYCQLGNDWGHADLTERTGAPPVAYLWNGYGWEAGQSKQVVYTTYDGHVHELYCPLGGGWTHADLTETGAPPVLF